jgi:nucleoside-diphosphate-sugar epimerase
LSGKKVEPVYSDPKPGDVKHSLGDINKAKKLLDYQVKTGFEEGLKITLDWYAGLNS